jgi:ankyrin repeat protein
VVKRLLDAGADPNARDSKGWTAMHHAVFVCPTEAVMKYLLEAGGDPIATSQGQTAADLVATGFFNRSGRDVVRELLLQVALGTTGTRG